MGKKNVAGKRFGLKITGKGSEVGTKGEKPSGNIGVKREDLG